MPGPLDVIAGLRLSINLSDEHSKHSITESGRDRQRRHGYRLRPEPRSALRVTILAQESATHPLLAFGPGPTGPVMTEPAKRPECNPVGPAT